MMNCYAELFVMVYPNCFTIRYLVKMFIQMWTDANCSQFELFSLELMNCWIVINNELFSICNVSCQTVVSLNYSQYELFPLESMNYWVIVNLKYSHIERFDEQLNCRLADDFYDLICNVKTNYLCFRDLFKVYCRGRQSVEPAIVIRIYRPTKHSSINRPTLPVIIKLPSLRIDSTALQSPRLIAHVQS